MGCSVGNCPKPHRARGYCSTHYAARRRLDPSWRDVYATGLRHGTMTAYVNYKCRCDECAAAGRQYRAEHRRRFPGAQGDAKRKSKYGITAPRYAELMAAQDGRCAVCRTSFKDVRRQEVCVDHDHQTGQVRGLLCHDCNLGIGFLGDNVDRITNAIAYLKAYT